MFEQTVKAAAKEQTTAWDVIRRAADDCDRAGVEFTAASTVVQLRDELAASGIALEASTCKSRLGVASFWWQATPRQQEKLETVGWTVVREFHRAGWSPEAACSEITAARGRLTQAAATDLVREPSVLKDTEKSLTDAQVAQACEVVSRAIYEWEQGTYEPGPEVALLLSMIRPKRHDWDAALETLTGGE